ncbi:phage terminase large subunit [Lentzea aerocolonigenes]|uniref:phage terminase large subunit n=1 Tax=Lentzea aerocolonigenes TaxID=68170 RepID=UPI0004C3CA59|nr:phage terminase large subunit [Lentzea aerocolonigenes]MCP2248746.1 phage terminase large subunit [Lentzea aerocolonigenes]
MTAPAIVKVEHELRGAARELMCTRDPEVLLSGPAGTGKSRSCMIKLHTAAMKYPGMSGLAVRKTARSLASSFTEEWEDLTKAELETGVLKFFGGSQRKPAQYQYENGSTITLGGLDDPIKIMSTQRDLAYVQESTELTEDDWQSLVTRMRGKVMPYKQIIADCNPSHPKHFLKQRANEGVIKLLISVHEDNPRFFHADGTMTADGIDYMSKLDSLTGVRYLRLRKGLWVAAEGVIYDGWDESHHLIDRFEIPEDWPRYWIVDFGFRNAFVAQFWAEDPDGRLYLYRELYMTERLVEDHAKDILRAVTKPTVRDELLDRHELGPLEDIDRGYRDWTEPEPYEVITDHDAEGRATLEKYLGISTTAADKAVLEGIERVQARMKRQLDGKARIFFMRDSLVELDRSLAAAKQPTCTVEEIPGYRWDPKDGPGKKDRPLKEQDHGCDCMRYMVAHKDLGSADLNFLGWV